MLIDVIVPIYNAHKCVENCLTSLHLHQSLANRIILINDASTDIKINKTLQRYINKNKNWMLITHKINQGFVKTANQGLKISQNHSILLNSDTIVSKYWLYAFKQSIRSNDNLGTATPWSNNAEICSFPKNLYNNNPIKNIDHFSRQLYLKHMPSFPELPTAVGFCMLITKQAKRLVGYFDHNHFGHGYGEENDYSLRVTEKGLKNILCDNAYVAHVGNQSFEDLGMKPDEKTMQRLLQKHPDYLQQIQQFIDTDPLNELRNQIIENDELKSYL